MNSTLQNFSEQKKLHLRGLFFGIVSAFSVSCMGILVNHGHGVWTPAEVVFHRSLIMLCFFLPFVWKDLKKLVGFDAKALWIRASCGAIGIVCLFFNLQNSSATIGAFLSSLSPVFTLMLAILFLKERVTIVKLFACFLGVACPIFLYLSDDNLLDFQGASIGICGAFSSAVAFVSLKKSAGQYTPELIIFTLSVATLLLSMFFVHDIGKSLHDVGNVNLGFIAASSIVAQFSLTKCYLYLDAAVAVVVTRCSVVFSVIYEYLSGKILLSTPLVVSILALLSAIFILQAFPDRDP